MTDEENEIGRPRVYKWQKQDLTKVCLITVSFKSFCSLTPFNPGSWSSRVKYTTSMIRILIGLSFSKVGQMKIKPEPRPLGS